MVKNGVCLRLGWAKSMFQGTASALVPISVRAKPTPPNALSPTSCQLHPYRPNHHLSPRHHSHRAGPLSCSLTPTKRKSQSLPTKLHQPASGSHPSVTWRALPAILPAVPACPPASPPEFPSCSKQRISASVCAYLKPPVNERRAIVAVRLFLRFVRVRTSFTDPSSRSSRKCTMEWRQAIPNAAAIAPL
jgi:hypothetical protein